MSGVKPACGATKADGTPCRSELGIQESGFCRAHDPICATAFKEQQRAGGLATVVAKKKAKAALPEGCPAAPQTLEDAAEFASWLTHAVTVGIIGVRVSHEAAFALRAYMSLAEKRDLQREIKALRAELKDAQRPRPRVV